MKIAFRTDASNLIGSGHIMRCLSLALELKRCGHEVLFVTRPNKGNLNEVLLQNGFVVKTLETVPLKNTNKLNGYEKWLGCSQKTDAYDFIQVIRKKTIDWLIIDHYSLDFIWENEVKNYVKNIFVIDDLANRKHACDLLLDVGWFKNMQERYTNLIMDNCRTLLGPKNLLLRQEFFYYKQKKNSMNEKIEKIFLFFGGSDSKNLTSKFLEILSTDHFKRYFVNVVVGKNHPNLRYIEFLVKSREKTNLHIQVDNIAKIIYNSSFGIGAGGMNTWERISLGLPSLVVNTAENQEDSTKSLSDLGLIILLNDFFNLNNTDLKNRLEEAFSFKNSIKNRINQEFPFLDGRGCKRVVNILENSL